MKFSHKKAMILGVLDTGPKTVEQLSAATGMSASVVKDTLEYLKGADLIHAASRVWHAVVYAVGPAPAKPAHATAASRQRTQAQRKEAAARAAQLREDRKVACQARIAAREHEKPPVTRPKKVKPVKPEPVKRVEVPKVEQVKPRQRVLANPDPFLSGWIGKGVRA